MSYSERQWRYANDKEIIQILQLGNSSCCFHALYSYQLQPTIGRVDIGVSKEDISMVSWIGSILHCKGCKNWNGGLER